MPISVTWTAEPGFDQAVFSPAGNDTFDPFFLRLVSTTVTFTITSTTRIFTDRLYFDYRSFPTITKAADARAKFVVLALEPGVVELCPYASLRHQGNWQYDNDYCDEDKKTKMTIIVTTTVQGPAVVVTGTEGRKSSSLVSMRVWFLGLAVLSLWGAFRLVQTVGGRAPRSRAAPGSGGPSSGVRPDE